MITINELNNIKIPLRDKLDLDKNTTFGIELEFDNLEFNIAKNKANTDLILKHWKCNKDSSVTMTYNNKEYGGEFHSPVFTDEKNSYLQIKHVCNFLKQNSAIASNHTSAHINIGSHILGTNIKNWDNFLRLWLAYENVIYKFSCADKNTIRKYADFFAPPLSSSRHRTSFLTGNSKINLLLFIKYVTKHSHTGINLNNASYYQQIKELYFDKEITNKELEYQLYKSLGRSVDLKEFGKLDFYNIKKNTNFLEFRSMNGTFNPIILQNAISFYSKLVQYSTNKNFDIEYINYKLNQTKKDYYKMYSYNDAIKLANLIFDHEIEKLAFLKQCESIYQNNNYQKKRTS